MNAISSFTQLRTWQHSKDFAVLIYELTKSFPESEKFGLVSQIRRSSVSVSANIAEGFSRQSHKEKVQFYSIALGSLTETLSHAYIANEIDLLTPHALKDIEVRYTDVHKMINGLIKSANGRVA